MKTLKYEGVTFFVDRCLEMSRAEFIKAHLGIFWQDRDDKARREMLAEAYDRMAPKKEKK